VFCVIVYLPTTGLRSSWHRQRPRITRRGVRTRDRLGRHCRVVGRRLAWRTGYYRLTRRYEPSARLFTAFLTLPPRACFRGLAS